MPPLQHLAQWLRQQQARGCASLYHANDFRSLFPLMSHGAFRALIHRARQQALLEPICQGVYQYTGTPDTSGYILFHAAALLRASHFNYISLETALSDAGIISQIPMGWITLVSTGRTARVDCGRFGTIEFIHTERALAEIKDQLTYDAPRQLFRAQTRLAIADMHRFNRDATADLIQHQEERA